MPDYSEKARRLAAASRAVLSKPEDDWYDEEEMTTTFEVEENHDIPDSVPLDRKRNVLIATMNEEELVRAHTQAQNRIERETDEAKLVRYRSYLEAVELELERRENLEAAIVTEPAPIADIPVIFGEDPEEAEERYRQAILPERDEEESPVTDKMRANSGLNFGDHPLDTPQSDRVV